MSSLNQHLYEYKRGVRPLVLHTTRKENARTVTDRLTRFGIAHHVEEVGEKKINVFFGDDVCVEMVRAFGKTRLSSLTSEEDFMLGIMLGYDLPRQCERYLKKKRKEQQDEGDLVA